MFKDHLIFSNNIYDAAQQLQQIQKTLKEQINILEAKVGKALRSKDPQKIKNALMRQAVRQEPERIEREEQNVRIGRLMKDYEMDQAELEAAAEAHRRGGFKGSGIGREAEEAIHLRNVAKHHQQKFNPNITKLATTLGGLRGMQTPPSEIEYSPTYYGTRTPADVAITDAMRAAREGHRRREQHSMRERSYGPSASEKHKEEKARKTNKKHSQKKSTKAELDTRFADIWLQNESMTYLQKLLYENDFSQNLIDDNFLNVAKNEYPTSLNWMKGKKADLINVPKKYKKFGYMIQDTYKEPADIKNIDVENIDWDKAVG